MSRNPLRWMMGSVAVDANYDELGGCSGGAVGSTIARYGGLATGIKQWKSRTTVTAAATIPASGGAANGIGWKTPFNLQPFVGTDDSAYKHQLGGRGKQPSVAASPWSGFGNALTFDGVRRDQESTMLRVEDALMYRTANGAFTIEGRFKPSVVQLCNIVGPYNGLANASQWCLFINTNKWAIAWYDSSGTLQTLSGTTTVVANTNYAVRVSYDGDKFYLYVDGTREAVTAGGQTMRVPTSTTYFAIGRNARDAENVNPLPYAGVIDEIRYSDIARSTGTTYSVDSAPFAYDANTLLLCHCDAITTYADSVAFFTADTMALLLAVGSTGAVAVTATITAIVYCDGVEIARGVLAGQSIGTASTQLTVTLDVDDTTGDDLFATGNLTLEVFVNVTLNPNAVGNSDVRVNVGGANPGSASQSSLDPSAYRVDSPRSPSEANTVSDSASRTVSNVRVPTETIPAITDSPVRSTGVSRAVTETNTITDTPVRTSSIVRATAETIPAITDTPNRTVAYQRVPTETIPAVADTPDRTAAYTRTPSETVTVDGEASRSADYPRETAETIPAITDSPDRSAGFRRETAETIPAITDSPARTMSASRIVDEAIDIVATADRLYTAGRSVGYDFQPVDPPLIDPTRLIAGYVRNLDGTPYLDLADVRLFRTSDNLYCQITTSSAVDGYYEFPRNSYDTETYWVTAHDSETGTGLPIQAVTERGLVTF